MDGLSCKNGDRCAGRDDTGPYPTTNPLCHHCLSRDTPHIRGLLYDYLDLAQLHEPSMSQAPGDGVSGSRERPIPIKTAVDALQREIAHVTATWEYELRVACRLSDPRPPGSLAPKARTGWLIQRALDIIGPRVEFLSRLPATRVCPTGIEDDPTLMEGWEAVGHLVDLHHRAKSMLGRTVRRFWVPGECWSCPAYPKPGEDGPLYRAEPRYEGDPMQISCDRCGAYRAYADYEHYQQNLRLWPDHGTAA